MHVFLSMFLVALPLFSGTLQYREKDKERSLLHAVQIDPVSGGFAVLLHTTVSGRPEEESFQSFAVDSQWATLKWTFRQPGRRSDISASRQGKHIILQGTWKGKAIKKSFATDDRPWNQPFQIGLAPFVTSGLKTFQFWSIGTAGPGEMKIAKFNSERRESASASLNGVPMELVRVRLKLSGLLSLFWHGDYWYRTSDGVFVRFNDKERSSELISESDNLPVSH